MSLSIIEASSVPSPMPLRGERGVSIGRAVDALIEAKTAANLRASTIYGLRHYLRHFIRGREDRPVESFTIDDIESWFMSRSETPMTAASNLGRLSSLFAFCVRRQWVKHNPTKLMERVRIERKPPFILSASQVAALLDYARREKPGQLAFWTLGFFAGLRPHEIARMKWESVHLDDGCLVIDAAASKVRSRRIVYLEPSAISWLKLAKDARAQLPCSLMTRRRYTRHACRLLGFKHWPHDAARHTAASYLLAKHRDAGKVALALGNSPGVLQRHYMQLVAENECLAYWSITPDSPLPVATPTPTLDAAPVAPAANQTPFQRIERALEQEPALRAKARERMLAGAYWGGTRRTIMQGERLDVVTELCRIAGCGRRTLSNARHVIRLADPDQLDALRRGRMTIAAAFNQVRAVAAA